MILLDTCAILYVLTEHRRARALLRRHARLGISPVSLLELTILSELGRLRVRGTRKVAELVDDPRFVLDDLALDALIAEALDVTWTTDPFDRLLVAQARVHNVRLATSDSWILEHGRAGEVFEL